jgi:hypothetical protein
MAPVGRREVGEGRSGGEGEREAGAVAVEETALG